MKILYCNHSIYNPGGMERVLLNKVRYLVEVMHWEVMIVTTDQHNRPSFYPLPSGVRTIDLNINYSEDNTKGVLGKTLGYLKKRKLHKERLSALLEKEEPDITVSLFPSESSFIPDLKDGSKKVLELHFNRYFRLQYNRKGLMGLIDRWRMKQDETLVRKFDSFVVLTEEDRGYWGELSNICVIPNAALIHEDAPMADVSTHKRVIAVGRLDYQKGFDRLIQAWALVQQEADLHDWQLDIFGQGEWQDMLNGMIQEKGLNGTCHINAPTKTIIKEYANSSFLVMSSHYEGFPMVMIEAMAQGLPVVTFDYKCGPKDIISSQNNGITVPEGDVKALAKAMIQVMRDNDLRIAMGKEAIKVTDTYSEERVMRMWVKLFEQTRAAR